MGNFNLKDLEVLANNFNHKEKFYVDAEQDKFIEYYTLFSEKKINDLLTDLHETIKYCDKKGITDFEDGTYTYNYIGFLIFKHFTSTHKELKGKAYSTHKKAMEKLGEVGLLHLFLNHQFDQDEVLKVYDRYTEITNKGLEFMARMEHEMQGVQNLKVLNH